MNAGPKILSSPLYVMLREERIDDFNAARVSDTTMDFRQADFRGLDLRGMNAAGLDMSGAYFRGADLRGVDFSSTNLEGASIKFAHISGCYFPKALAADEIRLSLEQGIRMRYR